MGHGKRKYCVTGLTAQCNEARDTYIWQPKKIEFADVVGDIG